MPETEPPLDFTGLGTAVAATFRPDYADVQARARKRRRRWSFGAAFLAVGLAVGGGSAVALTADRSPAPVIPRPDALPDTLPDVPPGPWRTTEPEPGARAPQPAPSFHEIEPGLWDPVEADKPLTGIFTELRAGDLDHLYLEYRDCAGKPCRPMLASTTDRGRTWRKLPMPASAALVQVHRNVVVAAEPVKRPTLPYQDSDVPGPAYWVSTDAGGTWRRAEVSDVPALPAGWQVRGEERGIVALDPATGAIARLKQARAGDIPPFVLDNLPASAGIWTLAVERTKLVARVSRDGGRTWDSRPLPDAMQPSGNDGFTMSGSLVSTSDGTTVYAREKRRDGVRVHVSTDGGHTWRTGATLDLDGPVMSLLPVGSRTVLVEGLHGTHRSDDQGMTFTKVGPALGSRGHAVPGGYTITTHNNEYSAWVSPDGATWTYVPRPEVP